MIEQKMIWGGDKMSEHLNKKAFILPFDSRDFNEYAEVVVPAIMEAYLSSDDSYLFTILEHIAESDSVEDQNSIDTAQMVICYEHYEQKIIDNYHAIGSSVDNVQVREACETMCPVEVVCLGEDTLVVFEVPEEGH